MGFSEQDRERKQDHKPREGQEWHPVGVPGGKLIAYDLGRIHCPDQGGGNGAAVADTVHGQTLSPASNPLNPGPDSNSNSAWMGERNAVSS